MTLRGLLHVVFCSSLVAAVHGAQVQAGTAGPSLAERYRLEVHGGGLGIQVDESVVVLSRAEADKAPLWVIERQRRDRNWCGSKSPAGQCVATDVTAHSWASSSSACPSLSIYADGFSDFKETGRERPQVLVTDTPLTTLEFGPFTADGKPSRMLSEYVGPLATWWQNMEEHSKNCWTKAAPVIDGQSLDSRLIKSNQ